MMKGIRKELKEKNVRVLPQFSVSGVIYRLIAAYMTTLLFFLIRSDRALTDFEFFKEIPLLLLLAGILAVFLLLLLVPWKLPILLLILGEGIVYCYLANAELKDLFFLSGCICVLAIYICYSELADYSITIPGWALWSGAIFLAVGVTVSIGIYCTCRFYGNNSACYDSGIFNQMFYYMKECGRPYTTCERDALLSHNAVHISPIFYLLLPAYMLIPEGSTLMFGHAFFTYSGIIPLLLICRNRRFTNLTTLGFSLCYVLYPGFAGGYDFFIHENCFLPPVILWLIFCLERIEIAEQTSVSRIRRIFRNIFCLIAMAFVLGVKEDCAVYVCAIALYFAARDLRKCSEEKNLKGMLSSTALWIFLLSVVYFLAATTYISTMGDGTLAGRFGNYFYDGSQSLVTMMIGIIKNPFYVISQMFNGEKLEFGAYLLLPLAFLPLASRRLENWFLTIPLILFNLMPAYYYQHNIHYQYTFGSGVLLIYLAVINYETLTDMMKKKALLLAVCASLLTFGFLFGSHASFYRNVYTRESNIEYRQYCKEAQDCIPEDASVVASTFLLPTFSQRDEIYELETTQNVAAYYVLDLRGNTNNLDYDDDPFFERIYYQENAIAVYRYLPYENE